MSIFLQAVYEGIINGSALALVAMGVALVWGVMGILSFSQGEFLMIAMYCAFYLNLYLGLDPIASLPFCMIIMFCRQMKLRYWSQKRIEPPEKSIAYGSTESESCIETSRSFYMSISLPVMSVIPETFLKIFRESA